MFSMHYNNPLLEYKIGSPKGAIMQL